MSALTLHTFPVTGLKLYSLNNRTVLLPLYHQAIQADIALKIEIITGRPSES